MSTEDTQLRTLMIRAVEAGIRHVQSGGLPFVGVVVTADGWVSEPGFNRFPETGDPTAHAEIVALRQVAEEQGSSALTGASLLATGEPCALCYRFAADRGISSVHYAVDRDSAAKWGFDYRASYAADHSQGLRLTATARHLAVDRALEPFAAYLDRQADSGAPRL